MRANYGSKQRYHRFAAREKLIENGNVIRAYRDCHIKRRNAITIPYVCYRRPLSCLLMTTCKFPNATFAYARWPRLRARGYSYVSRGQDHCRSFARSLNSVTSRLTVSIVFNAITKFLTFLTLRGNPTCFCRLFSIFADVTHRTRIH